ncbi:hypothetical protein, partial [Staphylococcus pettenkoferi]|uniref:hypothetical protein n=1 Tax=Staphylococcus pettenkoferi TaxID=170573 RepID=UPI001C92E855
ASLTLQTTTDIYTSESVRQQLLTPHLLNTFQPFLPPLQHQSFPLTLQPYQHPQIPKQLHPSLTSVNLYRRTVLNKYQHFISKTH